MEIVKESVAMLSNYEVLLLLRNICSSDKGQKGFSKQQQLATVTYETTKYLEKLPCNVQNESIIKQFLELVSPFNLTKAEKLQLLNHRPTTPVEIQLMVEESEERLSEDDVNNLLEIIAGVIPGNSTEDSSAANASMDQA